jgi:hypothetical protein
LRLATAGTSVPHDRLRALSRPTRCVGDVLLIAYVLPTLGDRPIGSIPPAEVLALLKGNEATISTICWLSMMTIWSVLTTAPRLRARGFAESQSDQHRHRQQHHRELNQQTGDDREGERLLDGGSLTDGECQRQ